ncbi:MAG: UDP-N-acetylglucosamine--N-acetylmuramyl-(pentapeptide) pyrophosphoryl-undecaprenol N-acetylglucosamine transferase [Nitrososphaerota archaeon]|jgi:UDP:flavonoid glycosyltransferase YjiC (YdhE family)|nr:UDP-N-acetylglucosamine--N-acetylmuramyl-(pentapeptide) pyrophosphoryl-undecaprenol N-acetylglucosamine transferase [Nitrososphaerota archaeon]MDG6912913.1 UDP-N-acetylglucosamine--N-acetylmuramyl-(pentapeptide) pyrophosphoryl-undecaprenol N-acetylglucosamine transferase [Nitrososphaerota archaeon]MDG6945484.1 UDP-N-acetylglucosamine--N-acetylmuramyl-(pentapeptide) pyrophosphoryl-undecaprenol N-acetylglucosamine transferase [Nitrososphaerota archaeon]MDG6952048.1 UDP-N-acetylglucosamine--N-ac
MKVYIGCFGSGLGHASRMLEMAGALSARGAKVEFSSSGEAAELVRGRGYRCNSLPLADVRYSEDGEFLVKETLLDTPAILARSYRQLAGELANIRRFAPDAVLGDSALPTVLAGKILRLPTFTVLNQLNLTSSHSKTNPLSRLLSVGISTGMGRLWKLSDGIFLPDLPPPYTVSEKNLWGSGVAKARYVGFISPAGGTAPDGPAQEFVRDTRTKVFWQVSGPPRTRLPFLRKALELSEGLSDRYVFVVTGGDPAGNTTAIHIPGGWFYGWCEIAGFYFRNCDLVVSRAGHGTVGQTMLAAKPSILVPIPKQPEQEGNADKAARLGVSLVVKQEELTFDVLEQSLARLSDERYRIRASVLGGLAAEYDAKDSMVAELESAATRGRRGPR